MEKLITIGGFNFIADEEAIIDFETLKHLEEAIINETTKMQYLLLVSTPIIETLCNELKLEEPQTIEDYLNRVMLFNKHLKSLNSNIDLFVGKKNAMYKANVLTDKLLKKSFADFSTFMDNLLPYFKTAVKINNIIDNEKREKEFARIILDMNRKIGKTFEKCIGSTQWDILKGGYTEAYKELYDIFLEGAKIVEIGSSDILSKPEPPQKSVSSTYKAEIPEKEKERLASIDEANDLYNQLCMDFMRDLEKQYALSSRDMYEYFVNVKFKKL